MVPISPVIPRSAISSRGSWIRRRTGVPPHPYLLDTKTRPRRHDEHLYQQRRQYAGPTDRAPQPHQFRPAGLQKIIRGPPWGDPWWILYRGSRGQFEDWCRGIFLRAEYGCEGYSTSYERSFREGCSVQILERTFLVIFCFFLGKKKMLVIGKKKMTNNIFWDGGKRASWDRGK